MFIVIDTADDPTHPTYELLKGVIQNICTFHAISRLQIFEQSLSNKRKVVRLETSVGLECDVSDGLDSIPTVEESWSSTPVGNYEEVFAAISSKLKNRSHDDQGQLSTVVIVLTTKAGGFMIILCPPVYKNRPT